MFPKSLDALSVSQLGMLATRQCRAEGLTAGDIEWLVEDGDLRSYRRSVYLRAGVPEMAEHRALAACLAAGPEAMAASWTGAALCGLPGTSLEIPEVHVTGPKRVRLKDITYHEPPGILIPSTLRRNVPTLEPAYLIASLGGTAHADLIQQMVDHALRYRLCTIHQLRAAVEELERSRRRRLSDVHLAIDRYVPGQEKTDSDLEVRALREITEAGFVPPVLQFRLALPERLVEIDIAWPPERAGVECKGSRLYRQAGKWLSDDEKSNLYAKYGWRIFTTHERTKSGELTRRLEGVVPRLRTAA